MLILHAVSRDTATVNIKKIAIIIFIINMTIPFWRKAQNGMKPFRSLAL